MLKTMYKETIYLFYFYLAELSATCLWNGLWVKARIRVRAKVRARARVRVRSRVFFLRLFSRTGLGLG